MNKTDIERYNFELDDELIAKYPSSPRDACKLLLLNRESNRIEEHIFRDILNILSNDYVIVLNNTKVMNARVLAKKISGGKIEIFITDILSDTSANALIRGKVAINDNLYISDDIYATVENINYENDTRIARLKFNSNVDDIMERYGVTPLPPYIKRSADVSDKVSYQTVYSKEKTSQASPTAGLHFTEELLAELKLKVADILEIRLDVGLGTFKPVSERFIEDHKIHKERYFIDKITAEKINNYKKLGKKILAIGTTVTRALESAVDEEGIIRAGEYDTEIFITEGYRFKVVNAMVTNFHLPKSTLLALVSAFAGYELIMQGYDYAKNNGYKFFSYGDAMLII